MTPLKFISTPTRLATVAILLATISPSVLGQNAPSNDPAPRKPGFFQRLFGGHEKPQTAVPAANFLQAAAAPAGAPATAPVQAPAPIPTPAQNPVQTPAPPQQPATPPPPDQQGADQPFLIKARSDLVNLVFTVTDKDGHFRKDLKKENFGLLDNGRPPAEVIAFTQQTNLPLRIGIMLDTSSSIRTRFKFEQDSALDFFLELLKPGDKAFVEGFDIQIALTQDYTGNVDLLNQGIRKLRPGGGTALFDSLYKTCQSQMLTLQATSAVPDVRKVIILVSDGEDNYSRALESDAIKMCERAETVIYAISTDTSPTRGRGGDTLKTIAEATGGQVFYPVKLDDMAVFFKNIEEELRSQYSLEYRPADFKQDGAFRTIYLQANDPRYKVRARKGYFAPKAAQ